MSPPPPLSRHLTSTPSGRVAVSDAPTRRPPVLEPPVPDPYRAPLCPELTVAIVTESQDQDGSLATLRRSGEEQARTLRFGSRIGSRRVVYVGHNPLVRSPAVWLTDGEGLCQALLRHPPSREESTQQSPVAPEHLGRIATARPRTRETDVAQWVERVDDNTFRLDRRLLHVAGGDGAELQPALRGVQGRMTNQGFHLGRVPHGTLPAVLGLQSGDRLVAINGQALNGPEGVARGYAALQRGGRARLRVQRSGTTIELEYQFE